MATGRFVRDRRLPELPLPARNKFCLPARLEATPEILRRLMAEVTDGPFMHHLRQCSVALRPN